MVNAIVYSIVRYLHNTLLAKIDRKIENYNETSKISEVN